MSNLYIVMGIAGSGKSTFIDKHMSFGDRVVSRDMIRFSLVKENEPYFSKEREVKKLFIKTINNVWRAGDTFVDATNLTQKGRKELLNKINFELYDAIYCVYVKAPLEKALEQNAKRSGRARVPDSVIQRMYDSLEEPSLNEGFDRIYLIENGEISHIYEEIEI